MVKSQNIIFMCIYLLFIIFMCMVIFSFNVQDLYIYLDCRYVQYISSKFYRKIPKLCNKLIYNSRELCPINSFINTGKTLQEMYGFLSVCQG